MRWIDLMVVGKKVNNYIIDATDNAATNAKFTGDQAQEYTVPAGKRWFFLGGHVNRDVSSTLSIYIKDSGDDNMYFLATFAAGTGFVAYPPTAQASTVSQFPGMPIIMDEGEYVDIDFGTAQTGGATASCVVIEVDI